MQIKESRGGSGSLDFEPSGKSMWGWNAGMDIWGFGWKKQIKFRGIENARDIYMLVSEKVRAAKTKS